MTTASSILRGNLIGLFSILLLTSCSKNKQETPADPTIANFIPGTYKNGTLNWLSTENSTTEIDNEAQLKVEYVGEKTVRLSLISSQHPFSRQITISLQDSAGYNTKHYEHFEAQSSNKHLSQTYAEFIVHDPTNVWLKEFRYFDFTMENGQPVTPSTGIICRDYLRQQ